ncbi:MAG: Fe-coproporphyrin synthase [Candidatus Sumerlaeota bacterium]|nr:Fe-coproporphyrin synthase [Candidatus Sumerlaeota bacterium]
MSRLKVVTMFVTNVCNARCETCFYWMHLNDPDTNNLTVDEIRQLGLSMPDFDHLLVSGGEPVMRKELPEIVRVWRETCNIKSVDMPTNGLLTKRIVEVVEQMLDENPGMMVTVGHSLDGFKETHDRLRGVPNNFEKTIQTIEALVEVRQRREEAFRRGKGPQPFLRLLVLACVNNQNIDEIERLAEWVSDAHDIDGMMFECLRGEPKDPELLPPTPEQFDRVIQTSMRINDKTMRRRFPEQRPERLAYIRSVYRLQRSHITKGKLPSTCQAGHNLAVLEPDGRLRLCELLDVVGDVREAGLSFPKVWFSEEAERQRNWIRDCRCSCTHCVNLGHSIREGAQINLQRRIDEAMFRLT